MRFDINDWLNKMQEIDLIILKIKNSDNINEISKLLLRLIECYTSKIMFNIYELLCQNQELTIAQNHKLFSIYLDVAKMINERYRLNLLNFQIEIKEQNQYLTLTPKFRI